MPVRRARAKFVPRTRTQYIPSKFNGILLNIAGAGIETDIVPGPLVWTQRWSPAGIAIETDIVPGSLGIVDTSKYIPVNSAGTNVVTVTSPATGTVDVRSS